jgi:hypothetical protein
VAPILSSCKFVRKSRAFKRADRSGESNRHAGLEAMAKRVQTRGEARDFAGAFRDS